MPTTTETLAAKVKDIHAKQEAALAAADAEGVSPEDRQKHLAEFDRLDAEKADANASLGRAKKLDAEKAALEAEPAAKRVVAPPHVPAQVAAGGAYRIPAVARPTPRNFAGPDAHDRAERFGLWVGATMYGNENCRKALAESYGLDYRATLSTVSNGGAAYFIPDPMSYDILKLQEEYGVFRRNARVVTMESETWKGPRWTVGVTASWVAEGSAPSQSEPGYEPIELAAKNLATYGKVTRNFTESSVVSIADEFAEAAAVAFADKEDDAAFNGTGASTYGGVTGLFTKVIDSANAASLHTATGEATLAALTMGTFTNVIGKFPAYPGARPKWYCHKSVWAASMARLMMASGGATPGDYSSALSTTFLGYPVEFTQKAPTSTSVTTGVTGILFADLRLAAILGDKRQRTMEAGMINDDMIKQLMTLFCSARLDINVHTVVDPKNSSAAGPVIGLKLG